MKKIGLSILFIFFGLLKGYSQITTPTVNAISSQTLCNGVTTSAVNFTGATGTIFNWTNNTTSIGLGASGTGNIAAFAATNTGSTAVTGTVTVTPKSKGYAYICNSTTVSVIDLSINSISATINVGNNPYSVAISPDGTTGYVMNNADNTVSIFNTVTNTVTKTLIVGVNPLFCVFSPDGTKAYVSNYSGKSISVINTSTNTVSTTINFSTSVQPTGIRISPDGSKIYVTNNYSGSDTGIYVINTTSNTIINKIVLPDSINNVVLSPDGTTLYAPSKGSSHIYEINTSTFGITSYSINSTLIVSNSCLSPDGTKLYAPGHGNQCLYVYNTTNFSLIDSVPLTANTYPNDVMTSADGSYVYVCNFVGNSVSVVNASTYAVTTTISGFSGPSCYYNSLACSPTGCTGTATSFTFIVKPSLSIYNVTGTGSYCSGGSGVAVGLTGSDLGVNYQLQVGGSNTGSAVAGTGTAINFGNQTVGTYTVIATNTTTLCTSNMTGSAIVTMSSLPVATAATNITCTGFTANWGSVSCDTSYVIDVYTGGGSSGTFSEGFNAGTTAPTGWSFTQISGTYTTSGNFGIASPSLKFGATNDQIITPAMSGAANQLSFWLKSQSASGSSLLIEGYNGTTWVTVNTITTFPTTGTIITYNSSSTPVLPSNLTKFRFTYTKSSGSIAFDDISISYNSSQVYLLNNQNVSNVTTYPITGLSYNTTYYYVVRGIVNGVASANSNIITTNTGTPPSAVTITPATSTSFCSGSSVSLTASGGTYGSSILLNDSFKTSSFASGWTTVIGSGDLIALSNSNNAGGNLSDYEVKFTGNSQSTSINDILYYGPINTTGNSTLTLAWNNYLSHYPSTYVYGVSVQTSTDHSNWHNTSWVTNPVTTSLGPGVQTLTINTADVGSSTFYLAFKCSGFTYGMNNWYLDNINLSGTNTSGASFTWTPTYGLNTNTGATVTASPSATTTYTATSTINGCSSSNTIKLTPLPVVGPISGNSTVAEGGTTSLSDTTSGGIWSSSNTSVANINSSGVVTGSGVGSTVISYKVTSAGCTNSVTDTIKAFPVGNQNFKLLVNEFCIGTGGGNDQFIELLVDGHRTCTDTAADMRGWIIDDQNGWYSTTTGITPGSLRFANSSNWANVPYGSLIVLYNSNAKNSKIPSDDPTDANHDYSYIVPDTSSYLEKNSQPTSPYSHTFSYPSSGYTSTGTGTWQNNIFLDNNGDAIILVNPTSPSIAEYSIAYNFSSFTNPFGTPTVSTGNVSTNQNAYLIDSSYTSSLSSDWGIEGSNLATPGSPNGGVNTTWINSMRHWVASITGTNTVCVGATTQLTCTTIGGTWSSSNTALATVDTTGKVTGVSAGSVTIKYLLICPSGVRDSATYSVTVNAIPTVAAITGTTSICVGKTTILSDATSGGAWSSSNTAIATIAVGVVTGVSAGTDTISYSVTSSGCTNAATAVINVYAYPQSGPITGYTIVGAGNTTSLSGNASGGIWSSSTPAIAGIGVSSGVVTGVAVGNTTIKYVVNNNGCNDSTTTLLKVPASASPVVCPIAGFNINSDVQCVNGNSFTFTNTSSLNNNANSAIATWLTNSSASATTSGIGASTIASQDETVGSSLNSGAYNSSGHQFGVSSGNWPTSLTSNYYEEFIEGPVSGYNLTVSSISLTGYITGGSTGQQLIGAFQYSTDGGVTYTSIGTLNFSTSSGAGNAVTFNYNGSISVTNGTTIRIRMYVYAGNTVTSSRSIVVSSATVSGTTVLVSPGTMTYAWTYGDGGSSASTNPTHTYSSGGTYYVKLVTTSSTGCSDSITKSVSVETNPNAIFTINTNPQCLSGNSFTFTNTSTGTISGSSGSTQAYSVLWPLTSPTNAGYYVSGVGSTTISAQNSAVGSGLTNSGYNVTQGINISSSSWPTSVTSNAYIDFILEPSAGYTQTITTITADSIAVTGGGTSNIIYASFQYSLDGVNYTTIGTTQQFPSNSGQWSSFTFTGLSITVPDASVVHLRVYLYGNGSTNVSSRSVYIKGMIITGTTTIVTTAATIYSWSYGDGTTATTTNGSHIYAAAGTDSVKLVVSNGGTCKDSVTHVVTINTISIITQPTTTSSSYCINATASSIFITASGSSLTYQWYSTTSASNSGGTLISGATSATYFPPTSVGSSLYYYCVVGSSCGSVTSNISGNIIVNFKVIINLWRSHACFFTFIIVKK